MTNKIFIDINLKKKNMTYSCRFTYLQFSKNFAHHHVHAFVVEKFRTLDAHYLNNTLNYIFHYIYTNNKKFWTIYNY